MGEKPLNSKRPCQEPGTCGPCRPLSAPEAEAGAGRGRDRTGNREPGERVPGERVPGEREPGEREPGSRRSWCGERGAGALGRRVWPPNVTCWRHLIFILFSWKREENFTQKGNSTAFALRSRHCRTRFSELTGARSAGLRTGVRCVTGARAAPRRPTPNGGPQDHAARCDVPGSGLAAHRRLRAKAETRARALHGEFIRILKDAN